MMRLLHRIIHEQKRIAAAYLSGRLYIRMQEYWFSIRRQGRTDFPVKLCIFNDKQQQKQHKLTIKSSTTNEGTNMLINIAKQPSSGNHEQEVATMHTSSVVMPLHCRPLCLASLCWQQRTNNTRSPIRILYRMQHCRYSLILRLFSCCTGRYYKVKCGRMGLVHLQSFV